MMAQHTARIYTISFAFLVFQLWFVVENHKNMMPDKNSISEDLFCCSLQSMLH